MLYMCLIVREIYEWLCTVLLIMKAIDGPGIGKVVACGSGKYDKDDVVVGVFTWADYALVKEASILSKLDRSEFPLSYHLGVLGILLFLFFELSRLIQLSPILLLKN